MMKKFLALLMVTLLMWHAQLAYAQGTATIPEGFPQDSVAGNGDSLANYLILGPYVGSILQNYRKFQVGTGLTTADGGSQGIFTLGVSPALQFFHNTGATTQQAAVNAILAFPSIAAGDLVEYNGSNWVRFPKGSNNQVLTMVAGVPTWSGVSVPAPSAATYLTTANESATLPNSAQALAGTGITLTGGTNTDTIAVDSTVLTNTSTNAGVTNKTFTLPSFGWNAGAGNFKILGSAFAATVTGADWAANRALSIPDPGTSAAFVLNQGAFTFNQVVTFALAPVLTTQTLTIGAFTVTVPAATDTLVNLASTQTLLNKSLTNPTFTNNSPMFTLNKGTFSYGITASVPGAGRTYNIPDGGGNSDFVIGTSGMAYTNGGLLWTNGNQAAQVGAGSAGNLLQSNGAAVPTWIAPNAGGALSQIRLYTNTGAPNADSSGASSTLFVGPLQTGNSCQCYTGSSMVTRAVSEVTVTMAALTVSGNYDVYYVNTAGSGSATITAWTNSTTPPAHSVDSLGRLTKSGDATSLLVGSFTAVSATTTEDDPGARLVSNVINPIPKRLFAIAGVNSFSANTTTYITENASTVNGVGRVSYLQAIANYPVFARYSVMGAGGSSGTPFSAIGFNSTTTGTFGTGAQLTTGTVTMGTSSGDFAATVGSNFLQKLVATGTNITTFYVNGTGLALGPTAPNYTYLEGEIWN